MTRIFHYQTNVELNDTDATGVIFYGHIYQILHRSLAHFLRTHKMSIGHLMKQNEIFFPVVHSEANYYLPMKCDDVIDIKLNVEKISEHSFTFFYELFCDGSVVADAKTTHVLIDAKKKEKIKLTDEILRLLKPYLSVVRNTF